MNGSAGEITCEHFRLMHCSLTASPSPIAETPLFATHDPILSDSSMNIRLKMELHYQETHAGD